ncbi:MAG: ISAs1 family transposase [Aestuariibacter sp.]|nr:ISAs1 family transposase [Aestuariibacter sp.]
MRLQEVIVRPAQASEESRFREGMQSHHYLGALPKIGNTLWYVATWEDEWVALLSFSAAALKCGARDRWIGWDFRRQYDRLHLIANNSRFLILPHHHHKNLASRILSLCQRRIQRDWTERFGYPVLLLETFVDPTRFVGTIYQAANWELVGHTKGYQRTRTGYSNTRQSPKRVFVQPLQRNAQALLASPLLNERFHTGTPRMKLTAQHMRSLPEFFRQVTDPRRAQGRRHPIDVVLAIAAAAVLCGMCGYKAISDWAQALGPKARARFRCRYRNGSYIVPSESILRDVLIRVDPVELDQALQAWNVQYGAVDESLAIDGKTMCNAIDEAGRQTHIMSVVGHQSTQCYTQKKVGTLPVEGREEEKQTNEIKTAIPLLDAIDIQGKTITADALLTQRELADYLVEQRSAHYHFTVKGNQKNLLEDTALYFDYLHREPDYTTLDAPEHGRIEIRKIWVTTDLNEYLDFPHVQQAFMVERITINKKSGKQSQDVAYGITSKTPHQAGAAQVLRDNREHWSIENGCHYIIDWNYDEDRSRIRKGSGPENITRLRRFAVSIIKSKGVRSVAQTMRNLTMNTRLVFDYLRMTRNSCPASST